MPRLDSNSCLGFLYRLRLQACTVRSDYTFANSTRFFKRLRSHRPPTENRRKETESALNPPRKRAGPRCALRYPEFPGRWRPLAQQNGGDLGREAGLLRCAGSSREPLPPSRVRSGLFQALKNRTLTRCSFSAAIMGSCSSSSCSWYFRHGLHSAGRSHAEPGPGLPAPPWALRRSRGAW